MSRSVHLAVWWGCRTIVADQERLDRTLVGVRHRGPSTLEPPQNVKDYEGRCGYDQNNGNGDHNGQGLACESRTTGKH